MKRNKTIGIAAAFALVLGLSLSMTFAGNQAAPTRAEAAGLPGIEYELNGHKLAVKSMSAGDYFHIRGFSAATLYYESYFSFRYIEYYSGKSYFTDNGDQTYSLTFDSEKTHIAGNAAVFEVTGYDETGAAVSHSVIETPASSAPGNYGGSVWVSCNNNTLIYGSYDPSAGGLAPFELEHPAFVSVSCENSPQDITGLISQLPAGIVPSQRFAYLNSNAFVANYDEVLPYAVYFGTDDTALPSFPAKVSDGTLRAYVPATLLNTEMVFSLKVYDLAGNRLFSEDAYTTYTCEDLYTPLDLLDLSMYPVPADQPLRWTITYYDLDMQTLAETDFLYTNATQCDTWYWPDIRIENNVLTFGNISPDVLAKLPAGMQFTFCVTDIAGAELFSFELTDLTAGYNLYTYAAEQNVALESGLYFTYLINTSDIANVFNDSNALFYYEDHSAALPPDPVKPGYTFVGWYLDEQLTQPYDGRPITGDISLYAKFEINTYTVTLQTNGGDALNPVTAEYNTTPSIPDATRTGYTFAGWFTDAGLSTPYTAKPITGNFTLYAKWTINTYTVTLQTNGGNALNPVTADYNTTPSIPDAKRTGYTFAGWFTDTGLSTPYTAKPITGDFTLYAKWTINSYTVTFDTRGGTAVVPISVEYNSAVPLPEAPARVGFEFVGWFKNNNERYTDAPVTGNLLLIAHWKAVKYTVTFIVDGEVYTTIEVDYGTTLKEVEQTQNVAVLSAALTDGSLPEYDGDQLILTGNAVLEVKPLPVIKEPADAIDWGKYMPYIAIGVAAVCAVFLLAVALRRT